MKKTLLILFVGLSVFGGGFLSKSNYMTVRAIDALPLTESDFKEIFEDGELELDPLLDEDNIVSRLTKEEEMTITNEKFFAKILPRVNVAIGAIAIVWLVILGLNFVFARGHEDKIATAKAQFAWILLGLFIVMIAEIVGFQILSPQDSFLEGESLRALEDKAKLIVRFFQYIAGGIALLQALISGYRLITKGDDEGTLADEKKFLKTFIFGTILILLGEMVIRVFSFRDGVRGALEIGVAEISGLINFFLTFVAGAATLMLIFAGFYYVISMGDEERTTKAKRIILGCIVGIVLAFSAYSISSFLIV